MYIKKLGYFIQTLLSHFLFKNKKKSISSNQDGMAVLETLPLLVVFIVLMTHAMGYWGAIHSAVLSSISARNYTFETFRNRSNLVMLRQDNEDNFFDPEGPGIRLHAVIAPGSSDGQDFIAHKLPISFAQFKTQDSDYKDDVTYHNNITGEGSGRTPASVEQAGDSVEHSDGDQFIWHQIGYGYCVNFKCGDNE